MEADAQTLLGGTEEDLAVSRSIKNQKSSERNDWITPPDVIARVKTLLGRIELDPASSPSANKVIGAERFYSLETNEDGLELPWEGRVYCNPPYGRGVTNKWVDRFLSESFLAGVLLVNATPGSSWFKGLWNHPVCFTDKRIQFLHADTLEPRSSPTHSNAIVFRVNDEVLRKSSYQFWRHFEHMFGDLGHIVFPER